MTKQDFVDLLNKSSDIDKLIKEVLPLLKKVVTSISLYDLYNPEYFFETGKMKYQFLICMEDYLTQDGRPRNVYLFSDNLNPL